MMAPIFPEISAIFALPAEVLLEGQLTQSDSWRWSVASSPLADAGARDGRPDAGTAVPLTLPMVAIAE
ncbi:MAG: hypothetical protein ABJB74_15930 [Gemmatimonas sp.]